MRIAYFGLPLAGWLLHKDGHELTSVVLSPVPAPGIRRLTRAVGPERVERAAELSPEELAARAERRLRRDAPDLLVSWYWTRKLPLAWMQCARLGGIGVHPSLLPKHRGPNPFFWAIDGGDTETGVTVHRLDAGYDTGEVLAVARIAVGSKNAWQLARALDRPGLAQLRRVARQFADDRAPLGAPQDDAAATWAPEPEGDALRVEWSWPTERVLRRIRALSPVPGLALDIAGLALIVMEAEPATKFPAALLPGEAAAWGDPPRLVVRTGDGAIALTRAVLDEEGGEEGEQGEPVVLGREALTERFTARRADPVREHPKL